ncbi:hypothetical protein EHQ53_14360 [Leptospira langatensis]|uniref:DUF3157 family protein n=1 Tax=Leptospira langatensis TaxID=2484983 RepID=A0A5F1ZQ73_9LEPT|nr:hypothetical protein [Leptospira langatensis]TGK01921.1 hypothetical protein EHO57_09010 [Leptospira langatensis]TGL39276.1 hypothetical protein EHQ53_14360 [Leptospira langatensis]
MKKTSVLLLILFSLSLRSEESVYTKAGKKVLLKDDYTWQYAPDPKSQIEKKQGSARNLAKNKDMSASAKSKFGKYSIFFNPNDWNLVASNPEFAEFHFVNPSKSSNAMAIYDGAEIPLENFPELLILSINQSDPEARILNIEDCSINGTLGKIVTYKAHTKGLKLIFYTFITSGSFGSIQFSTFTLENQFDKEKANFEKLLSGLVVD